MVGPIAPAAFLSLLAVPALAVIDSPESFEQWVQTHGKRYETKALREQAETTFMANSEAIAGLRRAEGGSAEYGHTCFGDLSPREFQRSRLPRMDAAEGLRGGKAPEFAGLREDPPAEIDWRTQGAVTPVKDQASCGSCWAESAVANIESVWYLANKASMSVPVALSVEQVIECDAHDNACYGGFPKGAYRYAIEHGGLAAAADYPYRVGGHTICLANQTFNATCGDGICSDPPLTSSCDLTCSDRAHRSVARISSWVALPESESRIASYLAAHGPVSVGMDASGGALGVLFPWLQFYKRGIASPGRCTDTIDHGVLLVGYGEEAGKKYWTVKNSWGTKWGEAGYFRIIRGLAKCGIDKMATSAVVKSADLREAIVV
mmetsp:Transcript_48834/g.145946  ORF Transcript_48834/g.145946 Transcript_48834/m.145946 type:complete len:377 (+) Transcript_48834:47-1177(+)